MRFILALLFCSTVVAFANGEAFQYSPGWSPGQATKATPSASTAVPFKPSSSGGQFSWTSLLTSGPLGALFARSGINMTERMTEAQRKANMLPWDDRIPMITDDNFEELIFNETFATPEEEEARLWFLVVTVTTSQRTGLSAIVDKEFNEAYNISVVEGDLPNVRWGRIDYLNVTRLTTKWAVWRAPMFIVAKDRGRSLRFFHPQQIGAKAPIIHTFLEQETWRRGQPWSGPWAPGGSREDLLDKYAVVLEFIYFYMSKVPRWMYIILSGGLGSIFLNLFHRKKPTKPTPVIVQSKTISVATFQKQDAAGANPSRTETTKEGNQKRRSIKK